MRLINTPRVVGYPTLEECAAAYPLFMVITRSLYVKEYGERNIPHYVRGYVASGILADGDFYMDYESFVWEKHEYALPQPADYRRIGNKELEENRYGS